MRENGLVYTQVTVATVKLLRKIRDELQARQSEQRNNGKKKLKRITKREVCEELVKRCVSKKII